MRSVLIVLAVIVVLAECKSRKVSFNESCGGRVNCVEDVGLYCTRTSPRTCQCKVGTWDSNLGYCVLSHQDRCESASQSASDSSAELDRCNATAGLECVNDRCECADGLTWNTDNLACE